MKGDNAMKKRIISAIAMMAFVFGIAIHPVSAQVLMMDNEEEIGSARTGMSTSDLPIVPNLDVTYDQLAPVGEGVLLLAALGGAYLLGKRRKEQQ